MSVPITATEAWQKLWADFCIRSTAGSADGVYAHYSPARDGDPAVFISASVGPCAENIQKIHCFKSQDAGGGLTRAPPGRDCSI